MEICHLHISFLPFFLAEENRGLCVLCSPFALPTWIKKNIYIKLGYTRVGHSYYSVFIPVQCELLKGLNHENYFSVLLLDRCA